MTAFNFLEGILGGIWLVWFACKLVDFCFPSPNYLKESLDTANSRADTWRDRANQRQLNIEGLTKENEYLKTLSEAHEKDKATLTGIISTNNAEIAKQKDTIDKMFREIGELSKTIKNLVSERDKLETDYQKMAGTHQKFYHRVKEAIRLAGEPKVHIPRHIKEQLKGLEDVKESIHVIEPVKKTETIDEQRPW